ncbi:hypothetical protein MA03_07910 [Infirmifilum uzonense]|uniref:Transposase n=1 Tax=Infirmifilum uzonense TaxID=1550241 RepID=A0A0F7FJG3_9CREN|nr:RNA-guided endonuclease TnpB family protein [Infirmifilum uzonense]AKG39172.1 hypothetical protein MA03_07910 [Infirmifilum uzonense]
MAAEKAEKPAKAPPRARGGGGAKSRASRRKKRDNRPVRAPAPPGPSGGEESGPVTDEMCAPVETGGVRAVVLRLKLNPEVERELEALADATAKMYNEVNFILRKLFFTRNYTDEKVSRIIRVFYRAYSRGLCGRPRLGSYIADGVKEQLQQDWQRFFGLLKAKKEGKLPGWMKPRPPGYKKDRLLGKREKVLFVEGRGYRVVNEGGRRGKLIVSVAGKWISLAYRGKLRWRGKQGTLVVKEVNGRWYAYIPVNVGVPAPRERKYSYMYINGERDRIQLQQPRGGEKAFIDLGVNNVIAAVTTTGRALLYRGGPIKAEYEYWSREAKTFQSLRDKCKNHGLPWHRWHLFYARAVEKRTRRMQNLKRNTVKHLVRLLWEEGVDTIYVGLPYDIIHEKGNKWNSNVWGYRKIITWLAEVASEHGMKVFVVDESKTSITCSHCGYEDKEARVHRGLYKCPRCGLEIHADINACLNIAHKAGYTPPTPTRIETYTPTHQGVVAAKRGEKSTSRKQ